MNMHKSVNFILWLLGLCVVFFVGFYVGTLDARENTVVITSQCAGISMEQSFSANYESIDGQVVRDEKHQSQNYSTRCLCFASDATHKNILVDSVEIYGDSEDAVRTQCMNDCQALCEERLLLE